MSVGRGNRSRPVEGEASPFLLVRPSADRVVLLPIDAVVEVAPMVPLRPAADRSPPVAGVARLRGRAVPVVALAALLEAGPDGSNRQATDPPRQEPSLGDRGARRLVVLRGEGERLVALAVDQVVGVIELGPRAGCGSWWFQGRLWDALDVLAEELAGVAVRGRLFTSQQWAALAANEEGIDPGADERA